jgi:DNA-binding FadR family transcriptional regulator
MRFISKPTPALPEAEAQPSVGRLATKVAQDIERQIIEMGWPVAEVLGSENELIERHGVSRAVFREALRLLEQHQVATTRRGPGGGIVVMRPQPEGIANAVALYLAYVGVDPKRVLEARTIIELHLVGLAAQEIEESGIQRLRAHFAEPIGDTEYAPRVAGFHTLLAEMSRNPALALFTEVLIIVARDVIRRHGRRPTPRDYRKMFKELKRVADAICLGDEARARARMERYLRKLRPLLGRPPTSRRLKETKTQMSAKSTHVRNGVLGRSVHQIDGNRQSLEKLARPKRK